jgi:hypothetical protein
MERADGPPDTSAAGQGVREQRFSTRAAELIRRLEGDPAVAGLAVRAAGSRERIEIEDIASPARDPRPASAGAERIERVTPNFFALHDLPIVAGRAFVEADARSAASVAIVNQVFAENHFGNTVLGRRFRFVRESGTAGGIAGPWVEVVGVVRDVESDAYEPSDRIYMTADVARLSPLIVLAIRMHMDPAIRFAPKVRETAAAVDPLLLVDGLVTAAERHSLAKRTMRFLAIGTTAVMLSVLLLSAAGIYAMMAFTVARRRREIGIRSALGANPRRALRSVFARASAQLSAGIMFGLIGTVALDRMTGKGPVHNGNLVVLLLVAVLMTTVGLLASIIPARRGLAIQPTEALREE